MAFSSRKITTANIQQLPAPTEGPGSSIFVYNFSGTDVMYKYVMNSWNLSTSTYTGKSATLNQGVPSGLTFKPDGLRMYCADRASETVFQYSMFNPYDIQNAVFSGEIDTSSSQINVDGVALSNDGLWLFTVSDNGTDADKVVGYQLSTAWDIRSASRNTARDLTLSAGVGNIGGMVFADSGTKLYIVDQTNDEIIYYTLSTAYDPSSGTLQSSLALDATYANYYDLVFKPDGTRLYVQSTTTDKLVEYSLSPAWTDTTPTLVTTLDESTQVATAYGMYINETAYTESDEGTVDYNSNSIDVTAGGLAVSSVYGSDWGTGDFTIEAWVYPTSLNGSWNAVFGHTYAAGGGLVYVRSDGSLEFYEGGDRLSSAAGVVSPNSWYHIALVNNSGTLTFYLNGTSVASAAYSRSITATDFYLGENQSGSEAWQGYITRANATNHAKYTAAFTPSTTYVADGNSLILLVTDGTNFRDISQAATITDNGAAVNGAYPP